MDSVGVVLTLNRAEMKIYETTSFVIIYISLFMSLTFLFYIFNYSFKTIVQFINIIIRYNLWFDWPVGLVVREPDC